MYDVRDTGQQDSAAGKRACHQASRFEFDSQNTHDGKGKKKDNRSSCPLICCSNAYNHLCMHMCVCMGVCMCTRTHTHK